MPGDPFYWSKAWRAFRALVLAERPYCEVPGCGKPSKHVDHIVARSRGGAPFDRTNARALCASHHARKTAAVDGGFGNPRRDAAELPVKGCDVNGWPLDPRHPWAARGR